MVRQAILVAVCGAAATTSALLLGLYVWGH